MVIGFHREPAVCSAQVREVVFSQYSKEQDDQNRYRPDHSFHFIECDQLGLYCIFIARTILPK